VPETSGLLVLTAIREEREAIERALADAGLPTRVMETGDGGVRAVRAARKAIAAARPAAIVGAGVAGALSDDLAAGEIVVSVRVLDAAEEAPPPDPGLVARALALPGLRGGTLLSVVRPALSAEQKKALLVRAESAETAGAATHGAAGPACVDMESAAWARAAAAAGAPYVILRAVSDTAEEELPRYLAHCMDGEGSIRRAAVARRALLHPGSIPALLRMRRRVAECSSSLGAAVAALAASLPRG
jgi:adenosylhomocysteine nucleosidase